jgi:zinc protease
MPKTAIPGPEDIIRRELANGITILVRENFNTQSVVITGSLAAGAIFETDEQRGLVGFATGSLMRGTTSRDFATIHEELETVGASLQISGGMHTISFGGKSLGEDLPLLLDILGDTLRNPSFPQDQVERLRGEILTVLKIREQNTRYMAGKRFREMAYPANHPYHRGASGDVETISKITIEDLRNYHATQFGPQDMKIVIVGNISVENAIQYVENTFGDWVNPTQLPIPDLPDAPYLTAISHQNEVIPGKSQTDIVLGVPGPSRLAEDFQAARVANNIFGVFGMYGRLGKTIREAQGLAYYSYSQLAGGIGPGAWRVVAGVDPSNVKQAVSSIRTEISRMIHEPISPDDLADTQSNLTGSLPLQLEKNEGVAASIFNMEHYDLGLDYLQHYADTINNLSVHQVQTAMAGYWSPDAFALALAGPELNNGVID